MLNPFKTAAVIATLAIGGSAQAAVLDLTGGTTGSTFYDAGVATVTAGLGTTLTFGAGPGNSVCSFGSFGCNGTLTLAFAQDVTNVSFDYGQGNPGDIATLSIFDGIGALIGNLVLDSQAGLAFADLSGFGTLRSILFDVTASTGAGYAFGNINYEPVDTAAIPLPASLPLLLAGLGGLAVLRKRRGA